VKDVRWAGVRFQNLLAESGPKPEARWIRFVSDEVPYDSDAWVGRSNGRGSDSA